MASNTSIFDFFNSLPYGFTDEQFEDRISKCPATLRLFKRSLVKCELQPKLDDRHFTPVSPPDTSNLNDTNCSSLSQPSLITNYDNLNVNENNTNSLLVKIKPAKALVKILNCPIDKVTPIDQVLSSDLSNKFFIIANNFDHKTIGCNWKRKSSTSIKFNVFISETDDYKVKRINAGKNLIPVGGNVFNLRCYEYEADCGNNYVMYVFSVRQTKLIQFVGIKPDCFCRSKLELETIINENKHLSPTALYLEHSDIFKNRQQISGLKNQIKMKSLIESKYKKNKSYI